MKKEDVGGQEWWIRLQRPAPESTAVPGRFFGRPRRPRTLGEQEGNSTRKLITELEV